MREQLPWWAFAMASCSWAITWAACCWMFVQGGSTTSFVGAILLARGWFLMFTEQW